MPYDYDLQKFEEKAKEKAGSLAHDIYDWNSGYEEYGAAMEIFRLLKEAYLAGYKQCEQDFHTATGL